MAAPASPGEDMDVEVEAFLASCAASAYGAADALLERLDAPASRAAARRLLGAVRRRFTDPAAGQDCLRAFDFRIIPDDPHLQQRDLSAESLLTSRFNNEVLDRFNNEQITTIEMPGIFVPCSEAFYEGLGHQPESIFRDKTVAELGSGNGWMSIALAQRWSPFKVYGLDINPRAIKIARINLYLNALDDDGLPVYDGEGKTLLDRIEFHESDLLSCCRDSKVELDCIVGYIPQVLHPNTEVMPKIKINNSSEEFLYSLCNYCAFQGFVEDQFGLGLIARAVEEGIALIKSMGIMIFSMGGRPGQVICERLFLRRGFRINNIWQSKLMQAADTDLSNLVEIEKNSARRFEFFVDLGGDQTVSARTACAYMKSGGRVSHALSMYSCHLRQPDQVKKIFEFLKDGFPEVSSSLDLSFDDNSVADENFSFLAYLASFLKENKSNPCEPPAGCLNFRNLVTGFMKAYHHIPLTPDNVVVFPSCAVAIENALQLFSPALAIVDEHLTRHLPKQWLISSKIESRADCTEAENTVTVIESPRKWDLLMEFIRKLKPQVVVTGMAQSDAISTAAFVNLLNVTKDVGSWLFLDISDHLELSRLPSSNSVLRYLAGNTLPSHAAILCGLVKNKVYSDLEVAFTISEQAAFCEALSQTVELLEGHTDVISQQYYGCLFHQLLAFQICEPHAQHERQPALVLPQRMIGLSKSAIKEAEFFLPNSKESCVIHMDLDRSFLPTPSAVKASIFESFVRQDIKDSETDVRSGIQRLLKRKYNYPAEPDSEIIYGNTSLALFNKLIRRCVQERGTFFFPLGTNGHYVSAAKFLNANTLTIPTKSSSGFKIEPDALQDTLNNEELFSFSTAWVYISGPTINPSGFLYSAKEIEELLTICARNAARVVIDTSFSGLEFQTDDWPFPGVQFPFDRWPCWDLEGCLEAMAGHVAPVYLLGELSLELTMAGLKFGFLISKDRSLEYSFPILSQPHRSLKYTFRKLLDLKYEWDDHFSNLIAEQKETLKGRANHLMKRLESCGWDVVGCHGGISMLAKPTAYIGKSFRVNGFEGVLDGYNIREALLRSTGLCISSSRWTGITDYCRFSFALEGGEFTRAMDCITRFKELILGGSHKW